MGRILLNLKSNSNIPEPHTEIVSVICIKQKVSLCLVLIKCGGCIQEQNWPLFCLICWQTLMHDLKNYVIFLPFFFST